MLLKGLPENPIQNVTLDNINIHAYQSDLEEHTENVTKSNVAIEVH
jgi:hypothetical protein